MLPFRLLGTDLPDGLDVPEFHQDEHGGTRHDDSAYHGNRMHAAVKALYAISNNLALEWPGNFSASAMTLAKLSCVVSTAVTGMLVGMDAAMQLC